MDQRLPRTRPGARAIRHLQPAAVPRHHHRAHTLAHGYSFNPVMAIPWMKDRCRKKKSRIMGSVPMAATAMS